MITIIVLLILAGVSISAIFGENGLLEKAISAREQSIIGEEKEQISLAWNTVKTNKLGGIVTAGELEEQLNEKAKVKDNEDNTKLIVTFNKTGNVYEIDAEGKITKLENNPSDDPSGSTEDEYTDFEITADNYMQAGITREGDVVIPETFVYDGINYRVTRIGSYAFDGCTGLTSITIPDSVTSIGYNAFQYCQDLSDVKIGNGVTSIEEFAFDDCDSLTSITIPNSVTSIGRCAFSSCDFLTNVEIPDSVTSIGDSAFSGCGLTNVVIPGSVSCIESDTFSYCYSLTDLTISEGVEWIEVGAFADCTSLTDITIPKSVKGEGIGCFTGCTSLTTARFEGLGFDAGSASGCPNLKSVTIGANEINLSGWNEYCPNLTEIILLDSVTSDLGGAFNGCESLIHVTIGNGVTSIGDYAFYGCTGLTSIIIPDNVTSIGYSAFNYCTSLTSIIIPDSVTSIGDIAFQSCALSSVTYKGIEYTSKTEILNALEENGVTLGNEVFDGNNLSE